MSLKYGALCFVLFIAVLFLAVKSYEVLTSPLELTPVKEVTKKSETRTGNSPATGVTKESAPIPSYNLIAQRNIFNPERKDFPVTGSGTSTKPVARPQVVLYGVTIAGDYQSASVVNPGRPLKKGEREQMTIRPGERIGEYKLAKISSDRIMLEAGEDSFEVLLYDPKMPKKRVDIKTESKPATITSAQVTSTSTGDVKGGSGLTKDLSTPLSTPASPGGPKSATRKVAVGETKEPSQEKSSAQTPTPTPGSAPTPTQTPVPMAPTPITPPFAATPVTLPPGMDGKPIPLPPGFRPQP
jgi:hypothetical protein